MSEIGPIYLQISKHIEDGIVKGTFKVDDQVPSMNEFAKIMKVNPATVGKGLNELVDRGILYKRRGIGMFVTEDARNIIIEERKIDFVEVLLPRLLTEAKGLNISEEELIERIRSEYNA